MAINQTWCYVSASYIYDFGIFTGQMVNVASRNDLITKNCYTFIKEFCSSGH